MRQSSGNSRREWFILSFSHIKIKVIFKIFLKGSACHRAPCNKLLIQKEEKINLLH